MLMVKPPKAPKNSSKGSEGLKALEGAASVAERLSIFFQLDPRLLDQARLYRLYTWRREVVFDLANLHDDGFDWFYRKWAGRFFQGNNVPSKSDVLKLRNDLRQIWAPSVLRHKQNQLIVSSWFHWRPSSKQSENTETANVEMWEPVLQTGTIVPVRGSLHAQMVQGVLEQYGRFAICENPDCPARFYLAKRIDQKYCEHGECTAYAQRIYALEWWNRKGKDLRQRKAKRKARVTKRRGK